MEDSCHRAKHTSITNHNVLLKCHLKPYLAKLLKKVQFRLQQYLKGNGSAHLPSTYLRKNLPKASFPAIFDSI